MTTTQQTSYGLHLIFGMGKEIFQTSAKPVQPLFSIGCFQDSVFGAFPKAGKEKLTFLTVSWQLVPLGIAESKLFMAVYEIANGVFFNVS